MYNNFELFDVLNNVDIIVVCVFVSKNKEGFF